MADFTIRSEHHTETIFNERASDVTVPEFLFKYVKESDAFGNNDFVIDVVTGRRHTYSEFEDLTKRIASSLYKRGMRKGDTLIYMPYDMFHLYFVLVGVWRANGLLRASYPEDDEATLHERVVESRAGWILCEPEAAKICLSVACACHWDVEVIVNGAAEGCTSLDELFNDDGLEIPVIQLTEDDTALILCTSGTTGKCKGSAHSHKGLKGQILSILFAVPFVQGKPTLVVTKGTHMGGIVYPLGCFIAGQTCLVMSKIIKENIFNAVHMYKPGLLFGFVTFMLMLVNDSEVEKFDFSSLEVIVTGGAMIAPTIENTLMKLPNMKAIIINYGLTEICPVTSGMDASSSQPAKYSNSPPSTIGKVLPGIELQIRDIETHEALGPNQTGEICIKSKYLFDSYYKHPEVTEKAFIDGYFLTGDVGYYDDEHFVFVVDRIKEIFKYYNNHISPTELEGVIANHPSVVEVCVVGVEDPDGGDRVPRAFVTVKSHKGHHSESAEDIRQFANENLASYKQLRGGLFILEELPKGKSGKISRHIMSKFQV